MANNAFCYVTYCYKTPAEAALHMQDYERHQAEADKQLCESLKNPQESGWIEFGPDGTSRPMQEPVNAVPFHEAHPGASAVPPNAAGSAPTSYQQVMPQQPTNNQAQAPAPGTTPPAATETAAYASAVPPAVPPAAAPPAAPPQAAPAQTVPPQTAAAPQYQQASMAFTPAPTAAPSSAPIIPFEQIQKALTVFASSAPERQVSVRNVLADFGVSALHELPEAAYPNFIVALRKLGVAI